ncbi:MAG: hypothetical protein NTZ05_08655 [Chloroflexi bacterium]|nr:hypothetical protein [Chloroflexota bacterium]
MLTDALASFGDSPWLAAPGLAITLTTRATVAPTPRAGLLRRVARVLGVAG